MTTTKQEVIDDMDARMTALIGASYTDLSPTFKAGLLDAIATGVVDYTGGGGGAVDSVFGRTGAVVAQSGDYTASEVGADASGSAAAALTAAEAYADAGDAAEASARASAVSSEASTRSSADASLAAAISTESGARISGDATNAAAITSEASTRASADTAEAAARVSGDAASVATAATDATSKANAAVTTSEAYTDTQVASEASTRAAADTAEATARAAADALLAPKTRTLTAGTGLTGGGDLSADRSFAADFGTGAGKVTQGNDSRLSDARTPTAHATSHKHGGSDEVGTGTPGANAIPKADGSGKLDAWISAASGSVAGLLKLAATGGAQAWSTALDGLAAVASNGSITRTGAGTYAARTLVAGSGQVVITNGDGVAGNPSVDLAYASAIRETAGPTTLALGAVANGQYLKRSGSTIVGVYLAIALSFVDEGMVYDGGTTPTGTYTTGAGTVS